MKRVRPPLDAIVGTAGLTEALDFWQDVFGFEVEQAGALGFVTVGPQRIRFFQPDGPTQRHSGALYAGTGYRVLSLIVDELPRLCERIAARGRRVATGHDLPGRWPIRFARDTDGNMLELIGRPEGAPLRARDPLQVGLTVADASAQRAFYRDVLELEEQPPAPIGGGMTRFAFDAGASTLKFWERTEPLPDRAGAPGRALGIRAVSLRLDDPAAARARFERHGVLAEEPGIPPDRASSLWLRDPTNCWIELRAESALR